MAQVAIDVAGQSSGSGIAARGFLGEALETDSFEVARDLAVRQTRRGRLLLDHRFQCLHGRVSLEWRSTGEAFVEDRAEGVNIAAGVDLRGFSLRLLRRHVGGRA